MGDRFELQPKESALIGMSVRDGALRIGASGPQRMTSVLCGIVAAGVAGLAAVAAAGAVESVAGVGIDHPAPLVAALVGLAIGFVALAVETARAVVVASSDGLTVRGRGLRRSLPWSDVADLQVVDTEPRRPDRPDEQSIGQLMSRRRAYGVGVVVLGDGAVVQLPNCTSTARSEGWAVRETPAEVKVAALRRYRERVEGPRPPQGPLGYAQVSRGWPFVLAVVAALLGPPAVWAVFSLASDDHVDLGALVVPWVVLVWVVLWSQRDRLVHLVRTSGVRGDRTSTSAR